MFWTVWTDHFPAGIQGAVFRGVGDVDHSRHDDVVPGFIPPVLQAIAADILRSDFSSFTGKGQDLVAVVLDGPGFVDADVAFHRGQDSLVGLQQGGDDRGVGLGAAGQEEDFRFRGFTGLPDAVPGRFGNRIRAVAG